jgi:glyoxylase-like metal-dependent hydrolase (beta-lactamase superfamily II)
VNPAELVPPNTDIAVAKAIDLGDRRVEIAHLGGGHTDGDLVVVVPDADVLFAGDLIESVGPPSFGPDSVPDEWPATLDAVIGLMTGATLAVPGHGQPVGREFVFEQRGRIAAQAAAESGPRRPELPLA